MTGHSGNTYLRFPSSALCCFHLNTLPNWTSLIKSFSPLLSFAGENYITLPGGANLRVPISLGSSNVHSHDSRFEGPDLWNDVSRLFPSGSCTEIWCLEEIFIHNHVWTVVLKLCYSVVNSLPSASTFPVPASLAAYTSFATAAPHRKLTPGKPPPMLWGPFLLWVVSVMQFTVEEEGFLPACRLRQFYLNSQSRDSSHFLWGTQRTQGPQSSV